MRDLKTLIEENHKMMVLKGFYEETQKADLPSDTSMLVELSWNVKRLSLLLNRQRKGDLKAHYDGHYDNHKDYIPDNFTPRQAHILRQMLHMVDEIGEFLDKWEESDYHTIDYEEFADIFIVWSDIAGFIDASKVVKAVEKKMSKNENRAFGYGRADDLGFIDLAATPGVIEELTGKAPTFEELAKAFSEQPLMGEGEITMDQQFDPTNNSYQPPAEQKDPPANLDPETDRIDKAEQTQNATLKKVWGNSFNQSLQGGQTEPLETSADRRPDEEQMVK